MRKYWFIAILLFLLLPCSTLFSDQIPGSQYFYLGNGISYFPLGASGIADFMRIKYHTSYICFSYQNLYLQYLIILIILSAILQKIKTGLSSIPDSVNL